MIIDGGPMRVVAVLVAIGAATAFGLAAVQQHRAVRGTLAARVRQLRLAQIGALLADRGWRQGFALMTLGTGLHVTALTLAPISLTQPLNVLAVPVTIIAGAAVLGRRPRAADLLAGVAVVAGVAAIVVALSTATSGHVPATRTLTLVAVGVAGTTASLHLLARLAQARGAGRHRVAWLPAVLLSVAGALAFGTASSTFRLLAQDLRSAESLPLPVVLALVSSIPILLSVGAWSIHQAYAAGAAAAVTATSALTDPLVAITIGITVLGETHDLSPARVLAMIIAAVVAGAGVGYLAERDHDRPGAPATTGPDQATERTGDPAQLRRQRTLHQTRTYDAHPARR